MLKDRNLTHVSLDPFFSLHLLVIIIFFYIYVFPFAILGINQGHNLKFEALIEVRPLTTLEGGQVATGGVNGESFGDDLLKKIFMCLILAVLGLCWCVGFLYFQRVGATP